MNLTETTVTNYLEALGADEYIIRLVNFETAKAVPITYTAECFAQPKTVGYLRAMNGQGFNIYARPVGWQYVLLDDLTRSVLADLATICPCALLETSPANFQAWLILPDVPPDRESARTTCRHLAERFGADLASAEPDHLGRVPGFTNRKEKYRQASGLFPFVTLHRWAHRTADFPPWGGRVLTNGTDSAAGTTCETTVDSTLSPAHRDSHSEQDFGIVIGLLRKGWTDDRIREHLLRHSPGIEQRKTRNGRSHVDTYINLTIQNARRRSNN